ncbi:GerMN domain-containing protein [Mobilicoccus massiliensis]|uniref:GerMN domain-containing protein n=1 Tax=Mobilicoccus massiliensis TaxID=1522310 RepID=UPI00058D6BD2|nr:GerMN domain-containing protein [Mobilicoccus massiliensis]
MTPRLVPANLRRTLTVTVLVAAMLLLAACGGLPRSGPINRGLEVGVTNYHPIRLQFEAPTPGASPVQIVQGFLAASSSTEDDYAAARAYLTSQASKAWRPKEQVTVYGDSGNVSLKSKDGAVDLSTSVVARVDETGRYLAASPGEAVAATLGLTQVEGEWRISSVPDGFGVWLSRYYFENAFGQFTLAYADPFAQILVHDYRWFPLGQGLPTSLARAQLAPVPGYLKGAVVTGFPPGTDLAVDSVPIVDKVAQIELTELNTTTDQRRAALAQILATMRQVPGVSAVAVSVGGTPVQVLGIQGLATSTEDFGYTSAETAPAAVVLRDGDRLQATDFSGWLRGGENQRPVTSSLPAVSPKWEALAVSEKLDEVSGVSHDRATLYRWTPRGGGSPPPFGSSLTDPAIDQRGRTWVGGIGTDRAPRIWWVANGAVAGTPPAPIEAPWLEGKVVAVRPSPGARRLAVALADPAGTTSVYVAGVSVGQGGSPVSLGKPWRVAAGLSQLRDLTWADGGSLAAVTAWESSEVRPTILPLGGPIEPLPPVRDVVQIATAGGDGQPRWGRSAADRRSTRFRGVLVVTSTGAVWRRVGNAWQSRGHVDELIVPGF